MTVNYKFNRPENIASESSNDAAGKRFNAAAYSEIIAGGNFVIVNEIIHQKP